jgi:hypothetical protein
VIFGASPEAAFTSTLAIAKGGALAAVAAGHSAAPACLADILGQLIEKWS